MSRVITPGSIVFKCDVCQQTIETYQKTDIQGLKREVPFCLDLCETHTAAFEAWLEGVIAENQ